MNARKINLEKCLNEINSCKNERNKHVVETLKKILLKPNLKIETILSTTNFKDKIDFEKEILNFIKNNMTFELKIKVVKILLKHNLFKNCIIMQLMFKTKCFTKVTVKSNNKEKALEALQLFIMCPEKSFGEVMHSSCFSNSSCLNEVVFDFVMHLKYNNLKISILNILSEQNKLKLCCVAHSIATLQYSKKDAYRMYEITSSSQREYIDYLLKNVLYYVKLSKKINQSLDCKQKLVYKTKFNKKYL